MTIPSCYIQIVCKKEVNEVKTVNSANMREVFAGGTANCPFCGKKFSDPNWFLRFLGYKISAKEQVRNHIYQYKCPKR